MIGSAAAFHHLFSVYDRLPLRHAGHRFHRLAVAGRVVGTAVGAVGDVLEILGNDKPAGNVLEWNLREVVGTALQTSVEVRIAAASVRLRDEVVETLAEFAGHVGVQLAVDGQYASRARSAAEIGDHDIHEDFVAVGEARYAVGFLAGADVRLVVDIKSVVSVVDDALAESMRKTLDSRDIAFREVVVAV